MNRTPIVPDYEQFPEFFHALLGGVPVFDSSCSPEARVYFIDRDQGFYLKSAPKGTLEKEAEMTRFFHEQHLGASVLAYLSDTCDWLLTERIPGEDCTHEMYLNDPKRLCETTAQLLWNLHSCSHGSCPVQNHTRSYLQQVKDHYQTGNYDSSAFPDSFGYQSAAEAWEMICRNGKYLKPDTLLHGDYCLPNIMLDNWHFTGFLDLDCAGVGDRHVDLFWGIWTLFFNLKTNRWKDYFLDAYGRSHFEPELIRTIAACEVFL